MNKKYMKALLAIIIVVQLAVPVTMLLVYQSRMKEFEEKGIEYKIKVDAIICEEDSFLVISHDIADYSYSDYWVFTEGQNGFYVIEDAAEKPEDNVYLTYNSNGGDGLQYIEYKKHDMPDGYDYYKIEDYTFYDEAQELENIQQGNCLGPQTQAYMVLKVYKGHFEIKEVYINGITFNEYYEKAQSGEIDIERYQYHWGDIFDEYDYDETDDYM